MEAGDRPLSVSVKSGLSPTWWVGAAGGGWVGGSSWGLTCLNLTLEAPRQVESTFQRPLPSSQTLHINSYS